MGSAPARPPAFDLVLEPRSDDYLPDDDRWRDQVSTLRGELRAQVDTRDRTRAVPGTKGAIDDLIVSLGSAGAFTAMVECLRAWLARDRHRRIDVRWDENGTERFVTFSGDAVDRETVRTIAQAAARRMGGEEWPAGTEPS